MLKIIICDDHQVVRQGVKLLMQQRKDMELAGEADSPSKLLPLLKTAHWDVLIMDLSFPRQNGIDIIQDIKQLYPELKILIFTMYEEKQYALNLLKAGAAGFVSKGEHSNHLIDAILKVSQGRYYISEQETHQVLSILLQQNHKKNDHYKSLLTSRELTVFHLIIDGLKNKEIAKKIGISPKTVSTFITRITKKLDLQDRKDIVNYARKNNIIP